MAKSKKYRPSSAIRYQAKMEKFLRGRVRDSKAAAFVATSQWTLKFSAYHEAYLRLEQFLASVHPEVPKGLYGFYRSFLFKAMKKAMEEIPNSADVDNLTEEFKKKLGLDEKIMRDILRYFGLDYTRQTKQ